MENIFQKIKNGNIKFCSKCGYMLHENETEDNCLICKHDKEVKAIDNERNIRLDSERLGGLRNYKEYTEEKFNRKDIFNHCNDVLFKKKKGLYIYGNAGIGKTHLAVALIRNLKDSYVYKPQEIYRKFYKKNTNEIDELISFFTNKTIVIDDIGVEKNTEFSYQTLYDIIDSRYSNYKNNIIITSNMPAENIFSSDRMISRILNICEVITWKDKDYRIE